MRQINSEIINEKVKYQEHQREKNNEVIFKFNFFWELRFYFLIFKIQNLKKELSDLQKIDFEKSNRLEKLQNQVTLSRDEKDSLEQKIILLNRKIEEVTDA